MTRSPGREGTQTWYETARRAGPAGSPDVVHSDRFALVDQARRVRSYYSPITEPKDRERRVEDLKRLAREGPAGQ